MFSLLIDDRGVLVERRRHALGPREHVRIQPQVRRWQFGIIEQEQQLIFGLQEAFLQVRYRLRLRFVQESDDLHQLSRAHRRAHRLLGNAFVLPDQPTPSVPMSSYRWHPQHLLFAQFAMILDHAFEQMLHALFGAFGQRTDEFVAVNFEHAAAHDFLQRVVDLFDFALVLAHFVDIVVEGVLRLEELFNVGIGLLRARRYEMRKAVIERSNLFRDQHVVHFEGRGVLDGAFEFGLQHFANALFV